MDKKIFLILFIVIPVFFVYSQELYESTVLTDIQTSSFHELTDWCRRLELPLDGSADELRKRLYDYYNVKPSTENQEKKESRIITIEKADNLDYFTIEKIDESYASISGDVSLTLYDPERNETHIIKADKILFNFEENYITATGNIKYTLESDTKTENFRGEKLTFNVDNSEGLFDKGITEQTKEITDEDSDETSEMVFYFKGDLINKTEENYVVLENGEITSCDFKDPHFRIKATKLWLLTNNEWAVLNGVIYLGRIPVFYFPAFLYGGDDIFFNPVFGYMSDFGSYIQTTTYLIGRKAEDSSSSFSFMQSDSGNDYLMREGLYLTEDPDPSAKEKALQDYGRDSENYLKLLLDFYSSLGLYTAIDMKLGEPAPEEKKAFPDFINSIFSVFNDTELYFSVAKTRLLETSGNFYNALFPDVDGLYRSIWLDSYFLDVRLPFRYGLNYSTTANLNWLKMNVDLELYSDKSYRKDFLNRSENHDFLSFLDDESDNDDSSSSETTACDWKVSLDFNPDMKIFNPWINKFSISTETNIGWNSKLIKSDDTEYDDTVGYFFYPDSLDLPILSMTISGALPTAKTGQKSGESSENDKNKKENLIPPWEEPGKTGDADTSIYGIPEAADDVDINIENVWGDSKIFTNKLTYSFTPKYSNRTQLGADEWESPDSITFENIDYSLRAASLDGKIAYSANVFDSFLDIDNSLSLAWDYNEHYNMELLSEDTAKKYINEDKQASDAKIKNNFTLSTTPILFLDAISGTRITYNFNTLVYQYDYLTDESSYISEFFKPDEDYISDHKIGLSFPVAIGNLNQSLGFTTSLPPLDLKATGAYSLEYGISTTKLNTSFSETDEEFKFDPLVINEILKLGNNKLVNNLSYNYSEDIFETNTTDINFSFYDGKLTADSNIVYDIENRIMENLSVNLGIYFMDLNLVAKNTYDYTFNQDSGWVQSEDKQFLPYTFKCSVKKKSPEILWWKNRINLNFDINSVLNMDLVQFTESDFTFSLGLNIEIYKFLDFKLSSSSINTSIYRYFPEYCSEVGVNSIDLFSDLLKSFNFFKKEDRYKSNFNLQKLTLGFTHDMHDWELNVSYSGSPYINKEGDYPSYDWDNELNIYLKWKSIPDIKSEISIDNEGVSF